MTAVKWLEISLLGIISFDSEELRLKYKKAVKIAKKMEEENQKNVGQITEKGVADTIGNCANCGVEFHIHKDIENKRMFSENQIEQLQSKVHKITGDGEVMGLFNEMLGINSGS